MKPELIRMLDQFVETDNIQHWNKFIAMCIEQGKKAEPTELELINYFIEKSPATFSCYEKEIRIAQQRNPGLFKPNFSLRLREEHDEDDDDKAESAISTDSEAEEADENLLDDSYGKPIPTAAEFKPHNLGETLVKTMACMEIDNANLTAPQGKMPILNPFYASGEKLPAYGKRRAEESEAKEKDEASKLQRIPADLRDQQVQDNPKSRPNLRFV